MPEAISAEDALKDTHDYWCDWSDRATYQGEYAEAVQRSLMTLKAMTYRPTGGIVAAVTTGLPERIGGERNWDYRYCWLRDTAFTLLVLMRAGYTEEAVAWRLWLLRAIAGSPGQVQTLVWDQRRAAIAGVGGGLAAGLRELEAGADWQCGVRAVSAGRVWRGGGGAGANAGGGG